jgi:SAM-dependent methyltransferase
MDAVSRRDASPDDPSRWVFNRLAADYARRPGYPDTLVTRLLDLAGGSGARVADLGAGTGHLAVPLARCGARVHAVEPARAMLHLLAREAEGLPVVPVHAAAEATGLAGGAFDLVVLADALQWVDPERAGREAARLPAPAGTLAVVAPRLADTPFLRALEGRIVATNPKARRGPAPLELLFSVAGIEVSGLETFHDEVLLEPDRLAAVLRSLSYVGPALGPAKLDALQKDVRALAGAHGGPFWKREISLRFGRGVSRSPRARPPAR